MSARIPLDLARPVLAIREASGLDRAVIAERRGVKPPTQAGAEQAEDKTQLSTILSTAAACGYRVVAYLEPLEEAPAKTKSTTPKKRA